MKTYEVRHSESEIDETAYAKWVIGMNDVLVTVVILEDNTPMLLLLSVLALLCWRYLWILWDVL